MTKSKIWAVVSSLLLVCVVLLTATGAALYFMKTGMIGPFRRVFLREVHVYAAAAMLVAAAVHHWLNRRAYKAEIKSLIAEGKDKTGNIR